MFGKNQRLFYCSHYQCIVFFIISLFVLSFPIYSQDVLEEPVFSSTRGFYENSFSLTIEHNIPGAVIKYTKDGTNPYTSQTAQSQSSPAVLNIDPTDTRDRDKAPGVVIRACAVKDGVLLTKIATHTFLFLDKIEELSPDGIKPGPGWPDPLQFIENRFTQQGMNYGMDPDVLHDPRYQSKIKDALLSIPTISLVTDLKNFFDPDSGIYLNALYRGSEWERCTSAELLNPDGTEGFQIDAGLRIRGGFGRTGTNFKHAFRLLFRKEYSSGKLHYPMFGDEGVTEFDNIDLRAEQNYSWAYDLGGDTRRNSFVREVFSRDAQRDMRQPYTRSRYYHLYINGTYWGLYQTQERSEASYGESYLGGSKEDYDVVKVDVTDSLDIPNYAIEATDGNLDAYQKLWEIALGGFKTDESYYKVQGLNPDGSRNPDYPVLIDIDNLIDYMLCTIYVADPDAPVAGAIPNNFYGMYNRNGDRGFIFFRHDGEHGLMYGNTNITLPTGVGQEFKHFNPRWLHQQLSVHPGYRLRFFDHVNRFFFNDGPFTEQASKNRIIKRRDQIEDAVIAESARWGDAYSNIPRTKDDDWLPEVDWILNEFFPTRSDVVLQQLRDRKLFTGIEPTVFNLKNGIAAKGTQITMNAPEGTIYYTVDGNDTHTPSSLQKASQTFLVPRNAEKRILIPTGDVNSNWKSDLNYDDSSWLLCNSSPGGIGYDLGSTYDDIISFDVEKQMYNVNGTCMIRIPFEVTAEQLNEFDNLTLRVQYNDGFVVYINKKSQILARNFSTSTKWNSVANATHNDKFIESIDITNKLSNILPGRNLLTIQALNISPTDSNFFFSVELIASNTMKSSGPISPSAKVYTGPITIDHTTMVKARVYKDEQWSPLNEVILRVIEGNESLTVTEIHYHPLDGESVDEKEFEFIELKNIGDKPIDLSGMKFSNGIEYTFPTGSTIEAGAYLVLVSNSNEFKSRYQFNPYGEFEGQLNNAGEKIVLENNSGEIIFDLTYKDEYPWPNSPDGLGYSLIRKPHRLYEDINTPDSWCASVDIHGKPGADDVVTSVETKNVNLPQKFLLMQNYPNPFNSFTTIMYQVSKPENVILKIFDILGREIKTLVNEEKQAGNYKVNWDSKNIPSGIYFYQMQAGSFHETKKMVLLK